MKVKIYMNYFIFLINKKNYILKYIIIFLPLQLVLIWVLIIHKIKRTKLLNYLEEVRYPFAIIKQTGIYHNSFCRLPGAVE